MTSSNAGTGELPSTMAAIFIAKTGGVEELKYSRDVPVPRPSEGEVLIRNEYAGVNFIDTYAQHRLYYTQTRAWN